MRSLSPWRVEAWHTWVCLRATPGQLCPSGGLSQGPRGFADRGGGHWQNLGHEMRPVSPQLWPDAEELKRGQSPSPAHLSCRDALGQSEREHQPSANMMSCFGSRCSLPLLCDLVWWVSNDGQKEGVWRCADNRSFAYEHSPSPDTIWFSPWLQSLVWCPVPCSTLRGLQPNGTAPPPQRLADKSGGSAVAPGCWLDANFSAHHCFGGNCPPPSGRAVPGDVCDWPFPSGTHP